MSAIVAGTAFVIPGLVILALCLGAGNVLRADDVDWESRRCVTVRAWRASFLGAR